MYNICIHLQTCLGRIFDYLFSKNQSDLLLQTKQSDDIEFYMIYKNNSEL